MAKKILAVVLAVMMAVSAMAVTAFADEILLHRITDYDLGTVTVTFDIPVYGLYGYLTAGDYMELTLPDDWGGNMNADKVNWSIIVDGVEWTLEERPHNPNWHNQTNDTFVNKVYLGFLGHNFDNTTKTTTVPQNTAYTAGAQTWRLVAKMALGDASDWRVDTGLFTNGVYKNIVKAQWYHEDGTPVTQSVSYVHSWNPQKNMDKNTVVGTYDFVTTEWSDSTSGSVANELSWDHTLAARAAIMGADSAELVVELTKPIIGCATYYLYADRGVDANTGNLPGSSYWWTHQQNRQLVDKIIVDSAAEELTELRFNVPVSILMESTYGSFNRRFVIFEDITLFNSTLMSDYRHVNRAGTGNGAGEYGNLSWFGTGEGWRGDVTLMRYAGKEINYARSGISGKNNQGIYSLDVSAIVKVDVVNTDNYKSYNTGIKLAADKTYVFEIAQKGNTLTDMYVITTSSITGDMEGDANPAKKYNGWDMVTRTYSSDEFLAAGAQIGDDIVIINNNWSGKAYDNYTIKVTEASDVYTNLGSDVAAKRIYLNTIVDGAGDAEPEPPTQGIGGEEDPDDGEGDNMNVADPEPEKNPHTGIALAIVPMLVAAAAAVVSKKH